MKNFYVLRHGGITTQDLYNLGARKMMLFELGPIGCFPLVMNKAEQKVSCQEELNTCPPCSMGKLYFKLKDLNLQTRGDNIHSRANLKTYLRHGGRSL